VNVPDAGEPRGAVGAPAALLEARGLTRRFGGLVAVDDVSLSVFPGEVRALIGSNGAGKSTLVAMLVGRLAPSSGTVHFEGRDVTALAPARRVALGMGYTFQITRIFPELDVDENVAVALQRHVAPGVRDAAIAAALDRFELGALARRRAGELSYGHRRLLELAMATAGEPRLLMLDEPTQGLSDAEIENFAGVVRALAERCTILLIEHNMAVVMNLASRVSVLHEGRLLADGAPAEIRANEAVQRAYLGMPTGGSAGGSTGGSTGGSAGGSTGGSAGGSTGGSTGTIADPAASVAPDDGRRT